MVTSLPIWHWSVVPRLQHWGFFFLDLERAYAFYWNAKTVLLLGGVFLLLLVLTQNNFGMSLLGIAWVFFSGFTQWWYSTPVPEMLGYLALGLVAAHYVALSERAWVIAVAALAVLACGLGFALTFYPPFQIPLFYLGVAILAGSLGPRLLAGEAAKYLRLRVAAFAAAILLAGTLLALYYQEAKPTIELMRGTVYPGSRIGTGGDVTIVQLFSGFYGFFMSETDFPKVWVNVCRASNFVLLFPIPAAVILGRAWQRQTSSALEWSLVAYLAVVCLWMLVGGPRFLAVATGFGMSHTVRWLVGVGLGSILLCCVFLARRQEEQPSKTSPGLVAGAVIVALLLLYSWTFNRETDGFASADIIVPAIVISGLAGYYLLARERKAFAICILTPSVLIFTWVNPVAVGLGPILEARPFREARQIVSREPDARWISYVSVENANLLKAAGARVFNGTNFVPPLEDLRVLDPDSSDNTAYNRYAHVRLAPAHGHDATFVLHRFELYTIQISPASNLWRQMGIRYVVLSEKAKDAEFLRAASLVHALPGEKMWVYRYNWQP
jgi:hypothetical protein